MPKRPWTPYAVLCGTELRFRRLCNFDLPNKQRFSLQRHKCIRIRLVPNSWDSLPVFCGTELRFCRLCNFDLPNKQRFSLQRHKSTRIRHSPNSGTVRRFPVLPTPCAKTAKSCTFCDSLPVSSFASENSCFRNSHEQKLQNSAKPNSGTVRRFSPLKPAFFFGALA